jgi:hypothetical protein
MFVDGERRFYFQMDHFSFDKTRYINSFTDYETYISKNRWYQKTWIDEGTRWENYSFAFKKGVVGINEEKIYHIQIVGKDSYGNRAELAFDILGKFREKTPAMENFVVQFKYDESTRWQTDDFEIKAETGSFYNDLKFNYKKIASQKRFFADVHMVHKNSVPIHKNMEIRIKTVNLPEHLQSRALMVNVDTLTGRFSAAGGEFSNGWVVSEIRNFGNYTVSVDTVPPKILPLSIKNKNILTESNRIRFKITDDLAGIDKIEGTLDGKWALFEYDAKSSIITHYFDNERFELGKRHPFILKVTDYKKNETIYEATFWK